MEVDYEREVAEFEWDIPDEYNLPDVVADHADEHGDRVAVRFRDADGAEAVRTYANIWDDAQRFANALSDLGVGEGDRVMHLFPRHPDAFAVQVGALAVGALLVPCSELLKPKDIEFRANDCEASVMVAHHSLSDMVEPVADETPLEHFVALDGEVEGWHRFSDLLDGQAAEYDGPELGAETPLTINYTSGTTGQPKPVQHRHRWLYCFNRINGRYWWGIDDDTDLSEEYLWATTGTGWAKWFWSPVGVALTAGATQFVYEGEFEPATFLDLLAEEEITKLCAVPTQYRMFAQEDLDDWELSLTDALSAGEPLNREPIQAFEDAFGITPRDGYGQTETVAVASNYPGIDVKPGSMGRPCPGIGTTIIDTMDETEVDDGEIGEIAIPVDSPAIFDGYYERPDFDAETFSGEYYRTGDLASRDEDGYLFFEGRADDIIISSGYRIGPFEVEDAIVAHPAVAEAAAVASPHEERGNVVKAYVVLADGDEPSDELVGEIQEFVKEETAPYKYPRRVEFVDELPKTSSGKTRRIELREEEHDD
ncbi:acyl-CoA synthetase [Haloarchaeobius sp. FL176]|uniref:acyl-CoA synthetase n=1 Tax=Haloarchaeobius sp. FL176 TaxID=2967129 RepID=UPI002147AD50|nr:AMP-binding protein [Haloarchaeobius sp. FL176]